MNALTDKDRAILQRRQERLARRGTGNVVRRVADRVAVVSVGGERFGIPAQGTLEIIPMPPVTRLPRMSAWMRGMTQIRGELVAVVDLASWFGMARSAERGCLVLVEGSAGALGLGVERVLGFRDVYADELPAAPPERVDNRPIQAVTHDLMAILDLRALLNHADLIRA
ncbi:MAG: chemotaxis protein CheW [Deltaproteobacteria bacterium]|nr:chemotaxis protein CheW [Deltaproteobacteria bacterium]